MEWNMEGFIDRFGMPVFRAPDKKIKGVDDEWITNGAIDYWEAEVDSLRKDADALMNFTDSFLEQNHTHLEMKVNHHYLT